MKNSILNSSSFNCDTNEHILPKEEESEIVKFYNGKSVFITGATGFLGKAIIDKLLRTITQIKAIYILIRPNNNNKTGFDDINARLAKLIDNPIYEILKSEKIELLNKIIPIAGDISLPELGISVEDQQLLCNEISVVIHSAATIKLNENLKTAINVNINGTKRILELCKRFKNVVSLVYVSTAYANCDRDKIDEIIYPVSIDPNKLIKMVEEGDELNEDKLIGNKPNTYTFTKALAEYALKEQGSHKFPISIVRPSMVTATNNEPMPGWIDGINGPTGLMSTIGKGLTRTVLCDINKYFDFIPVDYTVNFIITAAWFTAKTAKNTTINCNNGIAVYNCCAGIKNPLLIGNFKSLLCKNIIKYPSNNILWYPGIITTTNRTWYKINELFFHYIPAHLIDLLARVIGKTPTMLKIHKKIAKISTAQQFFLINDWKFVTNNMIELYQNMNSTDQKLFNFNAKDINWPDYLEKYWLGIRKYILKEDENTLNDARKQLRKKYWIHKIVQLFLILLLFQFGVIVRKFNLF